MKLLLKRIGQILLFIVLLILIINIFPTPEVVSVNPFMEEERLYVASQSGCGDNYPRNTMYAFEKAAAMGVQTFAIKIFATQDDVLVISDSDNLSDFSDGNGYITKSNYKDIKGLNFAYQFQDDKGSYPYRLNDLACITIDKLFERFQYSNFIIEIMETENNSKHTAYLLCEEIRKAKLSNRVVVIGDRDAVEVVRNDVNSTIFTAPSKKERYKFNLYRHLLLENLYFNLPFQYSQMNYNIESKRSTKRYIKACNRRNISVFLSSVNSEEALKIAKDVKCNGIITENPKKILELIGTDKSNE